MTAPDTFNAYVKSLRRLGVPFAPSELGRGAGHPVTYSYEHIMELALALAMRFYLAIPDVVLKELIYWRPALRRLYRTAFLRRSSGRGAKILVRIGRSEFGARGLFLDLQMTFAGGQLLGFGPPKALSPNAALAQFAAAKVADRVSLPIGLSNLAEDVVRLSFVVPLIRTGPRWPRPDR